MARPGESPTQSYAPNPPYPQSPARPAKDCLEVDICFDGLAWGWMYWFWRWASPWAFFLWLWWADLYARPGERGWRRPWPPDPAEPENAPPGLIDPAIVPEAPIEEEE
jgi:hypothetical protein